MVQWTLSQAYYTLRDHFYPQLEGNHKRPPTHPALRAGVSSKLPFYVYVAIFPQLCFKGSVIPWAQLLVPRAVFSAVSRPSFLSFNMSNPTVPIEDVKALYRNISDRLFDSIELQIRNTASAY